MNKYRLNDKTGEVHIPSCKYYKELTDYSEITVPMFAVMNHQELEDNRAISEAMKLNSDADGCYHCMPKNHTK